MAVLFYKSQTQELKENADGTFSPAVGALMTFSEVASTTPQDTFSDNGLTTANANPVVALGSAGRWPDIYLKKALYKVVCTTAAGDALWDIDILDGGDGTVTQFAGDAGGTANALTLTVSGVTELITGQKYRFRAAFNNTGDVTMDISGTGAKEVIRTGGAQLTADTLKAGFSYEVTYLSALDKIQLLAVDGFLSGSESVGVPANADFLFATDTSASGASIKGSVAAFGGLKAGDLANVGLSVTVGSGAITVALKTDTGTDPTSDNPVRIAFRSVTLTDTTVIQRQVTGALSMTISSGSTLGFSNDEAGRIYVGFIDNAGTVELCAWRSLNGVSLYSPPESELITTIAEGGLGAADSAAVVYSTSARSTVPIRVAGYFEITTGSTAGTWSNAPTKVQVMGPGVPRTGQIIQPLRTEYTAKANGSTTFPKDTTIPQISEGNQFMSQAVTPTNALNLLNVEALSLLSPRNNTTVISALFKVGTNDALTASATDVSINGIEELPLSHTMVAGTTSATTITCRSGCSTAINLDFNGINSVDASNPIFGAITKSFIGVTEIFV